MPHRPEDSPPADEFALFAEMVNEAIAAGPGQLPPRFTAWRDRAQRELAALASASGPPRDDRRAEAVLAGYAAVERLFRQAVTSPRKTANAATGIPGATNSSNSRQPSGEQRSATSPFGARP